MAIAVIFLVTKGPLIKMAEKRREFVKPKWQTCN